MDTEAEMQAGLRQEHMMIRNEILVTDRTCLLITGVLLSGTAGLLTITIQFSISFVSLIISPLWLIGHFYLTEKRFIILRIAEYLKTEVEPKCLGLEWESWHQSNKEELKRFIRVDPYLVESFAALFIIIGTPFFVAQLDMWDYKSATVLIRFSILLVFGAFASLRILTFVMKYMHIVKGS